jgi:steroid delta-isomerase-like uncharacterized protein
LADSRSLVEAFYNEVWNKRDYALAKQILSPDLRFRGSLGSQTLGVPALLAYVDEVHAALSDYRCQIEELIVEESRAAARMTFAGCHRGPLFGVAGTGRDLSWVGAAFFEMSEGRIASLWVLGDLDGLKQQLNGRQALPF